MDKLKMQAMSRSSSGSAESMCVVQTCALLASLLQVTLREKLVSRRQVQLVRNATTSRGDETSQQVELTHRRKHPTCKLARHGRLRRSSYQRCLRSLYADPASDCWNSDKRLRVRYSWCPGSKAVGRAQQQQVTPGHSHYPSNYTNCSRYASRVHGCETPPT